MAPRAVLESKYELLRIQQRSFRVVSSRGGGRWGGGMVGAGEGIFPMGAGGFGELAAQPEPDAGAQSVFPGVYALQPRALVRWTRRTPDRKSTRLNSSHLVISYAVFCLKKKK